MEQSFIIPFFFSNFFTFFLHSLINGDDDDDDRNSILILFPWKFAFDESERKKILIKMDVNSFKILHAFS